MPASAKVSIDLDALARNYRRMREAAAPSACAAVVKANAYGLGLERVAKRLWREGCREFFVATPAEGIELRGYLAEAVIRVFEGVAEGSEAALIGADLIPVLNSLPQVERWRAMARPASLHVDTGMTRLGLSAADVESLAADSALLASLELDCLLTHLACADQADHALNALQLERFVAARQKLGIERTSIGNSAGALLGSAFCGDLVRLGIALYGGNPFVDRASPVEPVVTLEARILQLRDIAEQLTVGYGATYAVEPPSRLAVLAIGYADGYPRSLGNRAVAWVDGQAAPIVGRVSMDLVCIDVSRCDPGAVREGQFVELFGASIAIDDVAAAAGTISYELLTGLGSRLERHYIETE